MAALRVLAKALESVPQDARLWAVYLPLYALRAGLPGVQLQRETILATPFWSAMGCAALGGVPGRSPRREHSK